MGDAADKPQDEIRRDLDTEVVVEVLESNWEIVQVFKMCTWIIHVSPDGNLWYQDIPNKEIESTIHLLRYPEELYERILFGICYHMVPAAREHLNKPKKKHQTRPPRS